MNLLDAAEESGWKGDVRNMLQDEQDGERGSIPDARPAKTVTRVASLALNMLTRL